MYVRFSLQSFNILFRRKVNSSRKKNQVQHLVIQFPLYYDLPSGHLWEVNCKKKCPESSVQSPVQVLYYAHDYKSVELTYHLGRLIWRPQNNGVIRITEVIEEAIFFNDTLNTPALQRISEDKLSSLAKSTYVKVYYQLLGYQK